LNPWFLYFCCVEVMVPWSNKNRSIVSLQTLWVVFKEKLSLGMNFWKILIFGGSTFRQGVKRSSTQKFVRNYQRRNFWIEKKMVVQMKKFKWQSHKWFNFFHLSKSLSWALFPPRFSNFFKREILIFCPYWEVQN
jgi:hypothetical protein